MMTIFRIFIIVLLFPFLSNAQSPKRELRAAWIATVGNIDWPSKQGLSSQQQQQEFIAHLNFLKENGFNAVIVQVRPAADVFYQSKYEPWSRYLSGKQGEPPFPIYDPLEFMIQETHKRNMEFHAWFNPYRALTNSNFNPNPAHHPTKKNPDWIIHYDGKAYFDPGNAHAREHIINVIMEAVVNYDIDAVHIDDYFYPYPVAGKVFNDNTSYALTGNGMNKADWRRSNVNTFIWQLSSNIKKEKPWVQFGVSPFGVWRNINKDPKGSPTNGATSCYDDLYSDILHWVDKNWIDYVAPQLYWERGHRVAPYDILLPWWKKYTLQNKLYIGLGVYRMTDAKSGSKFYGPNEILQQITDARKENANGIVMYSMKSFNKINRALSDSLKDNYFRYIALPPAFKVENYLSPTAPNIKHITSNKGILLQWDYTPHLKTIPGKHRFVVYKFAKDELVNLNDATKIYAITSSNSFIVKYSKSGEKYVVTTIDRCWNESGASNIIHID
jgi:uncharacterized lipoprotein YddW (UPF0748 family)